jgi:hypothetical protein
MNNHCKGCVYHHNAGHPKTAKKELKKYNDWCIKVGKTVDKSVGECKLKNLKKHNGV